MITFDEQKHEYLLDGKKLISVTQLMQKHGLAPSYAGVSSEVLEKKAERGTLIHAEIEDYIKTGVIGFTTECANFARYAEMKKLKIIASERIVYNDIVAGKFDMLYELDGKVHRVDFKTTATVHKDSTAWQLSFYDDLDESVKADVLEVWHFNNEGDLKIIELNFKSNEEIQKVYEAERKGEKYQLPQIVVDVNQLAIIEEATNIIAQADMMKKEAEARLNEVKEAVQKAMEENDVKSFENDTIKITYVAPVEKETIDSARLKKELPNVARDFTKKVTQKASVRITVKEQKQ